MLFVFFKKYKWIFIECSSSPSFWFLFWWLTITKYRFMQIVMVSRIKELGITPLELTLSLLVPSNIYYFLRQFFAKEVYQFFLEQQRRIHQYRHDVGEVSYNNPSSNHLFHLVA